MNETILEDLALLSELTGSRVQLLVQPKRLAADSKLTWGCEVKGFTTYASTPQTAINAAKERIKNITTEQIRNLQITVKEKQTIIEILS